jgi:hypothetical protein
LRLSLRAWLAWVNAKPTTPIAAGFARSPVFKWIPFERADLLSNSRVRPLRSALEDLADKAGVDQRAAPAERVPPATSRKHQALRVWRVSF